MFRESYEHIIHYYVLSEQKGRFGNLPYSQRDFQSQLQRVNATEY